MSDPLPRDPSSREDRTIPQVTQSTSNQTGQARGMLGKYALLNKIGQGGMGLIYEGEDTVLQRRVAVKILPDVRASNFDSQRRFLREARASAKLNHPNVVTVYDVAEHETRPFIVMELVEGGSLQDAIDATGPLPWREAVSAIIDAARGLVAAHEAGLIHRDLKPSNLLRGSDGNIKLADFGLATGEDLATLTHSSFDRVLGTPHYASPEQARCERVDALSDIYSLGATFYTLLAGRPPYSGLAPMQVLFAHCSKPIPNPREINPTIPEACTTLLQGAMAKDRTKRYPTAQDMLDAFVQFLDEHDPTEDNDTTIQDGPKIRAPEQPTARTTEQALPALSTTEEPKVPQSRNWILVVLLAVAFGSLLTVGILKMQQKSHSTVPSSHQEQPRQDSTK